MSQRNPRPFGGASALAEARAAHDPCSCMSPTLQKQHYKWESSLFTFGFLHNFAPGKVEEVSLQSGLFIPCKKFILLIRKL